ncbi:rhamnulokinase [Bacillus sonorensis]|uniref:rhamnulokinase n=1 Tax=Bacillus sonorensis TaxID=119858 RepID=UPI00227E327E|nr:rhamnulokinase [Bacillus sonorensis]MCY8404739.1 rhamnulokinase [Bacillus sonorensis]
MNHVYVSVDIGASSGRLILSSMEEGKLQLQEVHRFANGFTNHHGKCVWDIDHLLTETIKGLAIVKSRGHNCCMVGIDTWAVDYLLLGDDGKRLQEAVSYRDSRTAETMGKVFNRISQEEIYRKTGIQFLQFNTLYQLYEEEKDKLAQTKQILLIPDYLNYRLTGKAVNEVTNASTTQLFNLQTKTYDEELLKVIGLKPDQFPEIVEPGTFIGKLDPTLFPSYDLPDCDVYTVASHDTASAVVGTPGDGNNWAFLSSGTWSLIGIESVYPIVTEAAFKEAFTNEAGMNGTTRFLKNIIGMWVMQEIRKILPQDYNFDRFVAEAKKEKPFQQFVNFNEDRFLNPHNMVAEIQAYCARTNQKVPETAGELAGCVYSNLAIIYAIVLNKLTELTGKSIETVHIVGGGAKNAYLNQLTADVSGKTVYAGPAEATAIGNVLVQMMAAGEVATLEEARRLIRSSFEIGKFEPRALEREKLIKQFKEVTNDEYVD